MRVATLFRLWLPLAVSFELMMLEGPAFQAAIGRLPDAPLNLAAWGLTMGISLLIESPIIMLLATAIALVKDRDSFLALRRFVVLVCVGCTVTTGLVAFTPLFTLITEGLMGVPSPIVEAARPAMQIMLFWTAAIGWRRFHQGVLVRYGRTRTVTYGTAIRLATAIGAVLGLLHLGGVSGVQLGAIAIMAAVVSEALVTTLFARTVIRDEILTQRSEGPPLTQRQIFAFHAPLAATTLLILLAQPLVTAALTKLDDPTETLAAWPVVGMTLLVIRGGCFALQEITVAQARYPEAHTALWRFAWALGLTTTAFLAILAFTPLLDIYFLKGLSLAEHLRPYAQVGVMSSLLLPLLTALVSWARGLLVAAGATKAVYWGMGWSLLTLTGLLVLGVALRLPGMWVASLSLTIGIGVEYVYLARKIADFRLRIGD